MFTNRDEVMEKVSDSADRALIAAVLCIRNDALDKADFDEMFAEWQCGRLHPVCFVGDEMFYDFSAAVRKSDDTAVDVTDDFGNVVCVSRRSRGLYVVGNGVCVLNNYSRAVDIADKIRSFVCEAYWDIFERKLAYCQSIIYDGAAN